MEYKVAELLCMAQEWLNAEEEFQRYILDHAWVPRIKPEKYREYLAKETARDCAFYDLSRACDMVSANVRDMIATAKAIRRHGYGECSPRYCTNQAQ